MLQTNLLKQLLLRAKKKNQTIIKGWLQEAPLIYLKQTGVDDLRFLFPAIPLNIWNRKAMLDAAYMFCFPNCQRNTEMILSTQQY